MKNGLVQGICTVLLMVALAFPAFASGSFTGKVVAIDGETVKVKVDGAVPAWVKAGSTVKSGASAPKVVSVKGSEVTLKFGKAAAAKLKADTSMTFTEAAAEATQGC